MAGSGAARARWPWAEILAAAAVFAVSAAAFIPVLGGGFAGLDDPFAILNNPHIRGFTAANLRWMFLAPTLSSYQPLGWVLYASIYAGQGLNPFGFHLASLLLHAFNAAALFILTLRLLEPGAGRASGPLLAVAAAAGSALWALDPLNAEMVAWAVELPDLLASAFFLLSLLAYLRHAREDGRRPGTSQWLAASWTLFLASLLSRWKGLCLPLALVLLDYYPLRRRGRRVWLEKLPFFALAALSATVNARAKSEMTLSRPVFWPEEAAGRVVFYLKKFAAPVGLSPSYYTFSLAPRHAWLGPNMLAVLGLTLWLVAARRRRPWALAAWSAYLAALLPTLLLANTGNVLVRDHYAYLACLAAAPLAAAALLPLLRAGPARAAAASLVVAAVLGAFARLSWLQGGLWRDADRLWSHSLSVEPDGFYAFLRFNVASAAGRRFERALPLVEERVRRAPDDREAAEFLERLQSRRQAARVAPFAAENDRGAELCGRGLFAEALPHLEKAQGLAPGQALIHRNLSLAHFGLKQFPQAARHYQQALAAEPPARDANAERGLCLQDLRGLPRRLRHLPHALWPTRSTSDAHDAAGRELLASGRVEQAVEEFRSALAEDPDSAAAREDLLTGLGVREGPRDP